MEAALLPLLAQIHNPLCQARCDSRIPSVFIGSIGPSIENLLQVHGFGIFFGSVAAEFDNGGYRCNGFVIERFEAGVNVLSG